MNKIDNFIGGIERLEKFLKSEMIPALIVEGNTLCAKIANRVIETGKGDDGAQFTPYSTTEVPAFFYLKKSRTGSAEKKITAAAKSKKMISYREFRTINNLPSDKKNFSFTNEMWSHFGVKNVEGGNGRYSVTIGGKTASSSAKIGYQNDQEGKSIISPNHDEKVQFKENILSKIKNIINERP